VDPIVKDAYAKTGFRWKMLNNNRETGKRAQVMQLNKPKEGAPAFENLRNICPQQEPITIKAGLLA